MKIILPIFSLAFLLIWNHLDLTAQAPNNSIYQDSSNQYYANVSTIYDDTARIYETAIGIRLGSPLAVSAKHFVHDEGAVEAYVGYRKKNSFSYLHLSAAYQYHMPLADVENLFYYVGAGATFIRCKYKPDYEIPGEETGSFTSNYLGVQGYLGLDYAFEDIPLNLSVDWIPTINLGDNKPQTFSGGFWAISGRFIVK